MGLGITAAVIAAITSLSALKEYTLLAAVLAGIVAVISAASAYLKPGERAARHQSGAFDYGTLRARIELQVAQSPGVDVGQLYDWLEDASAWEDELKRRAPPL